MLNLIKSFYRSHRIGSTPARTLLWIWIKKDLSKIKGETGVDLAGGTMLNKRFFKTNKYVCVDIDKKKLDLGKNNNPEVIAINSKIQDYLNEYQQKKLDVLLCVQTMGANKFFEHDEILKVVTLMHGSLKIGGSMIFNIGKEVGNLDLDVMENKLSIFLEGKFKHVDNKFYGLLHEANQRLLPRSILFSLAYLMNTLPPLRTLFGLKKDKLYYCCKDKQ